MGTYTDHGVYKPDVGEIGWGVAVDVNFDLEEGLLAGGGGGGGGLMTGVDFSAPPYSAPSDGVADATDEIKAAATALLTAGGGILYGRTGSYNVRGNLAHLVTAGVPLYLMGDGPLLTRFIIGDDFGGDSLVTAAGRHGFDNDDTFGPGGATDCSFHNPDGHVASIFGGMWQTIDFLYRRLYFEDILGTIFGNTACQAGTIRDVTMRRCGDTANGNDPIFFDPNLEGGLLAGQCEDWIIDGLRVYGPRGPALRASQALRGKLLNSILDSAIDGGVPQPGKSTFEGHDLDGWLIMGNTIANGADDCLHLSSQGGSQNNVVVGNVALGAGGGTPGTGYGFNEYSANDEQVHTGNLIPTGSNVGTVNRA